MDKQNTNKDKIVNKSEPRLTSNTYTSSSYCDLCRRDNTCDSVCPRYCDACILRYGPPPSNMKN